MSLYKYDNFRGFEHGFRASSCRPKNMHQLGSKGYIRTPGIDTNVFLNFGNFAYMCHKCSLEKYLYHLG